MSETTLLSVRDLRTQFDTPDGIVQAVNGVSFDVRPGEAIGIVGESGSGKSVTALSIMGLVPSPPGRIVNGEIVYQGRDLVGLSDRELRSIRAREIAMIFQDPMTSLNPVLTVGRQLTEAMEKHLGMTAAAANRRAIELLELVGIPNAQQRLDSYPHQFSGGMRQRVMIAMAISCEPKLLIADEPTTALDVTIQAQIIDLVKRLRRELGMAMLWITHDLGIVAGLCDRVIVMYAGRIVESAPVKRLYALPSHPYTMGLLASIPRLDARHRAQLQAIPGLPPDLVRPISGCPFAARCRFVQDICRDTSPPLRPIADGHLAACHFDITMDDGTQNPPTTTVGEVSHA